MSVFSRPAPFTTPEPTTPEAFIWALIVILVVSSVLLFFIALGRKRRHLSKDEALGLSIATLFVGTFITVGIWSFMFSLAREGDEYHQQVQGALNTWLTAEHPEAAETLSDEQVNELWEEDTLTTDTTIYLLIEDEEEDRTYYLYESGR